MECLALGLVETLGLVPALEAADTAVKSADVSLAGLEFIGAGLVTVKILGDISSVREGVAAARAAAERLGQVRSHTVIGRTGQGIPALISPKRACAGEMPLCQAALPDTPAPGTPAVSLPDLSTLSGMRVVKLRKLARQLAQTREGFSMTPGQIKFARKQALLNAISAFAKARKI